MTDNPATLDLYPCNDLACLEISGQDSITFLQSQLTQDVQLLAQGRAALAGYCSAQGRLLATMVLVPTQDAQIVLALVPQDLLEGLVKRLRMFVLRSKVVMEVRSDLKIWGVSSETMPKAFALAEQTWGVSQSPVGQLVRAPSGISSDHAQFANAGARCWLITQNTPEEIASAVKIASIHKDSADWNVQDVLAGLPWIQDTTKDLFIPQTLNLDLIDGVSFTKGCFPGQEVVARAHYRAKVKRRMHMAMITPPVSDVEPAMDVFAQSNDQDPVGRIIQVANHQTATYILFEAPFKAVAEGQLSVGGSGENGETKRADLEIIALPYATEQEA